MEQPPLQSVSSSGSLTTRSTNSMEEEDDTLSVMENSPPPPPGSDTLLMDTHQPLSTDTEKEIAAVSPVQNIADSSAMMLGPEELEDEEEEVVTPFHKRKRTSVNYNLDDVTYSKVARGSPRSEPAVKRKQPQSIRGVIIGVWRDSDQADDAEKHVIYGFIDVHDRLRTRIYAMNRRGDPLVGNAPTGAGGCWVTFERVIFDSHLRELTPAEIKEYVKIQTDVKPEENPEDQQKAAEAAVLRAKANIARQEALNPGPKPVVHRVPRQSLNGRHSLPRQNGQTLHKPPSFQAVNAADIQTPKASPFNESKSHGVLLGYWVDSDEPRDEDKHAVFGVLSGTDCFRVKVQRVTRDGRFVDGNFPTGAGALWLHYDKVVFEPHLIGLNRPEVKEYCRIRQRQLDSGPETEKQRKINEAKAVQEAKVAVVELGLDNTDMSNATPEQEVRHSARSEQRMSARNQAESEAAAEVARKEKIEARERQHEKTRKEVAVAESLIQGAAQQELKKNLQKLNKVWAVQQAATLPGMMNGVDHHDVKYHNGIKYERKGNGPFQGKLVSQAQILSIDGEDFVEYRILTKPSFF